IRGIYLENCSEDFANTFQKIITDPDLLKISKLIESLYTFNNSPTVNLVSDSYELLNHSPDTKRMNEVIAYIRDNYREKVDLEDLANIAKMTKNSFCRYFKQNTGKTPIQFVSELRVSHACRLLRSSDMNLKEICYESGFNSFVNFHKIFKNITHTSPKQYKNQNIPTT